ncbi:MAG TPA: DJ-1/PfpI family protein [Terracidiphilus sp.]|jgi:cyclohexyl-isocyanide hydratase
MTEFLKPGDPFRVAMLVYPQITQLDLTGPQEVFTKVPGLEVRLYWKNLTPVTSASGLQLIPTCTFEDESPIDLLCVPGGPGQIELMADDEVLDFLRRAAETARYITSVCTGSLLLGAAGLLQGYRATTHWMAMDNLSALGAIAVPERVVVDRNRITGAGVTAGIDFALSVIAQLWGEPIARSVQLGLEYDPQPPFAAGSPRTAHPEEVQKLQDRMRPFLERRMAVTKVAAAKLRP